MISFEEAMNIVMDSVRPTGSEEVDFEHSAGRILAADVHSDIDMPPFDKSAMDGYACRREDLSHVLEVVEVIPAGMSPMKRIGARECAKIMTGAVVPRGADCVIKIEDTETLPGGGVRFLKDGPGKLNICYRAEDIRKGDVVLGKGTLVRPQEIAVLATVGCTRPVVAKAPKVGVIATGSELVEPGEAVEGSHIRNSNGYQLSAQARAGGADTINYGIAHDTEEALDTAVGKALAESEVLLLSGGVSMGDFDLVPGIMKQNGLDILFDRVAVKPGKPVTFGVSDTAVCFGLPGNPVSTFVLFEVMVKPYLAAMTGRDPGPRVISMRLGKTIRRKRADRRAFMPVNVTDAGTVLPVEYHGSAHIGSMCGADGLISMPAGVRELKEGSTVDVRQL